MHSWSLRKSQTWNYWLIRAYKQVKSMEINNYIKLPVFTLNKLKSKLRKMQQQSWPKSFIAISIYQTANYCHVMSPSTCHTILLRKKMHRDPFCIKFLFIKVLIKGTAIKTWCIIYEPNYHSIVSIHFARLNIL